MYFRIFLVVLVGALLFLGRPAAAQSTLGAIKTCAWIEDDTERLACYDRAVSELEVSVPLPASPMQPGQPAPSPVLLETERARREALERENAELRERVAESLRSAPDVTSPANAADEDLFGLPPQAAPGQEVERRTMFVAAARKSLRGRWILTMDNGQVWQQSDSSHVPTIRPGMTANISKASLGTFLLTVGGRTIRAKRVE